MARLLCSELGGIDPEKLLRYRATFICQYGLCCCIVWPSFFVDCTFRKNLGNLQKFFGQMVSRPPGKKFPVRLCTPDSQIHTNRYLAHDQWRNFNSISTNIFQKGFEWWLSVLTKSKHAVVIVSFSTQRSSEHFREFSVKLRRLRKVIGNPRKTLGCFWKSYDHGKLAGC